MPTQRTARNPATLARNGAARPGKEGDGPGRKVTLRLSTDAANRLGVYATMTHRTQTSVVEELILTHLRRFTVADHGR